MKIIFVCTGNICRSPYAEYLARRLSDGRHDFTSAGTSARAGNPATPGGTRVASEQGLDMTPHQATPLTADLVAEADLIFGMEDEHVEAVLRLDPQVSVKLLRPDGLGIPDPYGEDDQVYLDTYGLIDDAVHHRLNELNLDRSSATEEP